MTVGVINCGTNTVRLLIARKRDDAAEPGQNAYLGDVVRVLRFTRLGQGVDATRQFHPDALARTFAALDEYAAMIKAHGPLDRLRFLATSAARDATNRDEFFAGAEKRLGVTPEVISGEEEARLSFLGALAGGPVKRGNLLVIDIGGGSTEVIVGDSQGQVLGRRSFDMGSVRLRERFLLDDPPSLRQIKAARDFVASQLGRDLWESVVPKGRTGEVSSFIGVAGTNTSLSAMCQGLATYDPSRVHNSRLTFDQIHGLTSHLLMTPVADVEAQYPILEPMRAEVICAGALIADEVSARLGFDMLVRETDILDGAALGMMKLS